MNNHRDDELDSLFANYRAACPDPEPGAHFTVGLWERIEARRSFGYQLRRQARALVTLATAASLAMALFLTLSPGPAPNSTYVDVLAEDQGEIVLAGLDPQDVEGLEVR